MERSVALGVRLERGRKERGVGVAIFVATAWRGRADVRRHGLRGHFDPIATEMLVPFFRKLQFPLIFSIFPTIPANPNSTFLLV